MSSSTKKRTPLLWIPSLYLGESLPYFAVMAIAGLMYKRLGLSNTDLALYTSWLYLPWVIKPLWSPFVAVVKTERWWVLLMQLLICVGFAGVAFTLQTPFWLQASLAFFWILAFSSATHDIAADGLYILGLDSHDQSLYIGVRSLFYRIGSILVQGVLVTFAGFLERSQTIPIAWSITFLILAGVFIALRLWHGMTLPKITQEKSRPSGFLKDFGLALKTFFTKPHILTALLFMLFFRFPEGQLVKIVSPFLIDSVEAGGLGLSTEVVGVIYGSIGAFGLIVGGLLGGWCVSRHGLKRWLWPMVLAISLPNLVYVYLASAEPPLFMVYASVFIEQFGYGFGFTAYMLYLVSFSKGERSTAVFSICTAFQALGMMLPGMIAGWMADYLGYVNFFWWIMGCCLVTFAVTAMLKLPEEGK